MRGHRDLERVVFAAAVCGLAATLLPWEAVRLVAALPLAIFLPGYAIVAAAFGPNRLDPQRLLMLVLACGLSVLCLGGLLLDPLPGGIRTLTWALLLFLIVLGASRAAALRRPGRQKAQPRERLRPRPLDLAFGAAALAAAIGALAFAYTPLPAGDAAGYTALWMLPDEGEAPAVRVGVVSAEQEQAEYRLQVRTGAGKRLRVYRFGLKPGEEEVVEVPVRLAGKGSTRVAASLYLESRTGELYRRVTTWLPPERGGG